MRLAVIGHDDDGVPLEQGVDPASCLGKRAHGSVASLQRSKRRVGTVLVGGVVVVGEIEDEEVERVAGHEPPADRRRVRIDRSGRPVAPRERRAGAVGAEEVVEEEALRPPNVTEEGQRRAVAGASPVRGEVDGCGAKAGVGERLEQRQGSRAEVLPVHVDEGVPQRLADPGGTHGAERAPVLDEPLLAPVVPDEMRNLVDVTVRARRDGREADRGERREDRRGAPIGTTGSKGGERRCLAGTDRAFEHRRSEAVYDDENQWTRGHFASERRPAYFSGPLRARRAATTGRTTASR